MSLKVVLPNEKIEIVVAMKKKGCSYREIVNATGCSEWSIRKYCNDNGLSTKEQSSQAKEQIEVLLAEGYKKKEIAKLIGKSYSFVSAYCENNGHRHIKKPKKVFFDEIRTCEFCGESFVVYGGIRKKFCSTKCQRAESHQRSDLIRKRMKKDAVVDSDITLAKLFKRDNGICYLCGSKCDWNDYKLVKNKKVSVGNYPTIDHIIPIRNGGLHSWDNVKLAHFRCNCKKGVREIG